MLTEFDELHFPPFEGFPKESVSFLKKLKKNNNREWFKAHKDDFEQFVKFPMQSFIASMQPHFSDFRRSSMSIRNDRCSEFTATHGSAKIKLRTKLTWRHILF